MGNSPFASTAFDVLSLGMGPVLLGQRSKQPIWKSFNLWEHGNNPNGWNYSADILRHWVNAYPDANIGVLTRDCHCVDVDALETLTGINAWSILPPTPHCKRGARGLALMYRPDPQDPVRRTRTFSHPVTGDMMVEILANGRQTVLPPSIHPDSGEPYAWIVGPWGGEPTPLAPDMPALGQRHVDALEAALEAAGLTRVKRRRHQTATVLGMEEHRARYERWLAVKLADKYAAVDQAPAGARQQTLNDAVLSLAPFVRVGLLDEESLNERLLHGCHKNGWIAEDKQAAFDRQFEKALADGWDNELPALSVPVGEFDPEAARLMGVAPTVPTSLLQAAPMPTSTPAAVPLALLVHNGAALLAAPDIERLWTWRDWIPHAQVTLLYGDGGTGKTTLLMQLAITASMCGSFFGDPIARRKVLYISAEDELSEITYRFKQMCRTLGCDGAGVTFITLADLDDTEIAAPGPDGKMHLTALYHAIEDQVRITGADMVIFDPVADLFGGNDVDKRQVRTFIQQLRKRLAFALGCTVILAAHPSVDGIKTGRGTSGTVAWSNSCRSRIYFERTQGDVLRLSLGKTNRAKTGAEKFMKWVDGVFVRGDKPAETAVVEIAENVTERILDEIRKRPFTYRKSKKSDDWVGTVAGRISGIDYTDPQGSKKTERLIDQMIESGLLQVDHLHCKRAGRQVPYINIREN